MKLEVVEKQEHEQALARIARLEAELSFIKSMLIKEQWLSRAQTLAALTCSEATLHRLTKSGQLVWRKEGKFVSYGIESIRKRLTEQKIDAWAVDQRVLAASRIA